MQVAGGGSLKVYEDKDQGRHTPGPQALWQESVVLAWWALESAVGGVHRIGHEPNCAEGGRIALWNNLVTPQGVYKKTAFLPLREADKLPMGFGSGDDTCRYEFDGDCVWTIEDGEVSAKLRIKDYHPSVDCYPKKGILSEDFAAHHMEVAGAITGVVRAKGHEYRVKGLGMRDHGWGVRDWLTLLSHRWIAGVFGPDLSFCAVSWHGSDDSLAKFGWVVKGDKIVYARDLDILTWVECDAATIRGGRVRLILTTREVMDIECTPLAKGLMSYHHDIACLDTMCRITSNGRTGICDFETTANLQHGKRRPRRLVNGIIDDGFFAAEEGSATCNNS